jgi:hypothetical protein
MKKKNNPRDEFVEMVARMVKDGECYACGQDGSDPNDKCKDHIPFDMPSDDAVEALHEIVERARGLTGSR